MQCLCLPAEGSSELKRPLLSCKQRRRNLSYFRVNADASLFSSYTDVSVFLCPELSSTQAGQSADMAPKGSNKQQSEEDLLLQDFSRNLSAKSTALFYGNALIVSAIPICEYRLAAASLTSANTDSLEESLSSFIWEKLVD